MAVTDKYEIIIGLEVHAQLLTQTKMFCSCPNEYGAEPNTLICPICTGQPGTLPVVNEKAIELGIRAAKALQCEIHENSVFARKNYFYPDLPKGYQISQYEKPFCTKGTLNISLRSADEKRIGITRIHFEEDAGKSVHEGFGTLVNLNRAGVPLIEIVSEPDMRSAEEAGQYLRTLRDLLRYVDVCDGNMEQGNFRCDANISLRLIGEKKFGTKIELKNINSFKFVENAIAFEVQRQADILDGGGKLTQQTRSWDNAKGISELMREKEDAQDYRYFPEPDLPVLVINQAIISEIEKTMPELPSAKKERFQSSFQLSSYDAGVLTSTKELAEYFETVAAMAKNPKASANWVMNDLLGKLNAAGKEIEQSPVKPNDLGILLTKIESQEISTKIAKTVFEEMFETGKAPEVIIKEKGLVQISDTSLLESAIQKVIAQNPSQFAEYKAGKIKLLGFFVGQAMKETKGQANPALLGELVKKALDQ